MPDTTLMEKSGDFRDAFREHERQVRISTGRLACWLVILLMPLGTVADWFMYPDRVGDFFKLRLLCSLLVLVVWLLHSTLLARKHYPVVGMPIVLLPSLFMTWMVFSTESLPLGGAASPYYAALNLILLAVSAVGHWSMGETFFAVGSVICMYLGFAFPLVTQDVRGIFFINVYFLGLTGIIVIAGNYIFNRLRFREFVLRHELDKNKKTLEQTNQKLDTQNKALADTIKKLTDAELQLVQQEKMASLGVMSAGIIHEINNPLNYATTGLYTLRQKGKYVAAEQQADFEDVLKDVEEGVSRVKTIVSDLRSFSHPETESRDQIELAGVVESALRFLSGEWKNKVKIEQNVTKHQTIFANQNKIVHVVLNLLQNSLDALKSKQFNIESPTIWIEGRIENGLSRLIIRDNGPGIETQNLDKIFDPFFTTKDVGQGMGLGLSICYRIVQDYDGRITVRTEPGKFCEFTLEFPVKG
jgi:two-component system sensor histidine kinase PhcS